MMMVGRGPWSIQQQTIQTWCTLQGILTIMFVVFSKSLKSSNRVCFCLCLWIFASEYIYIYIYIHTHTYTHIHIYTYTYTDLHRKNSMRQNSPEPASARQPHFDRRWPLKAPLLLYIYIYIYIYTHIHKYIYIHMYTYTLYIKNLAVWVRKDRIPAMRMGCFFFRTPATRGGKTLPSTPE